MGEPNCMLTEVSEICQLEWLTDLYFYILGDE